MFAMAENSLLLYAKNNGRNYGIDLLRLVSMFLVVVLHILERGGVIDAASGINLGLAWFLKAVAHCCVNCFALISGYVCYAEAERPYKYRKYLLFWLQVFFYNFGIALIFWVFRLSSQDPVLFKTLLKSAFPVLTGYYWYVLAYTGLFFVMPWLNKLVRSISKKECMMLVLTLLALASFGRLKDTFVLNDGKSFAWLVFMYVMGAWIKRTVSRTNWPENIGPCLPQDVLWCRGCGELFLRLHQACS